MVLSLNEPENLNLFNEKKIIYSWKEKIYTYNNKNLKNENELLLLEFKKRKEE